jgi:hypothetical protein
LKIISHDDFSNLELENLKKSPLQWTVRESRLALLLQAKSTTSLTVRSKARALFNACFAEPRIWGDESVVEFLLFSTYHLHQPQAVLDMLSIREDGKSFFMMLNLIMDIQAQGPPVSDVLLRFEVLSRK